MKPAVFDYRRAASLDEAVELLSEYGSDAKILAGGQSLLPMMKLRLARPGVVVDLGRAAGLDYVRADGGGLAFGAMARLVELESALVSQRCPMLAAAARQIGHPPIRHRGTVCGSLAHADPAAELPALALALNAEFVAVGPEGRRVIPAERFFVTYLTTDLTPDELLAEVRFPLGEEAEAWGFQELSRRFGDYAMAAAAIVLGTAPDGTIAKARIALAGVADRAIRAREAEALLVGTPGEAGRFAEAARVAAGALMPPADVHGSSAYRRHLAGVLVERALADAWRRARPQGN
jgi:aerobic carbon-monoxide dehydrogenase medium subunit